MYLINVSKLLEIQTVALIKLERFLYNMESKPSFLQSWK